LSDGFADFQGNEKMSGFVFSFKIAPIFAASYLMF
jgi:hypothetical protein